MTWVTVCSNVKAATVTVTSHLLSPHNHMKDIPFPIVTQTQSEYGVDSLCDTFDDEDSPIITRTRGSEQDDVATHINLILTKVMTTLQ